MKRLCLLCALLIGLSLGVSAADPELAGNWIGAVDTDRGQMEIGLQLKVEKEKLTGVLKTAHGDWTVTAVAEKNGVWTVSFNGGGNEGQMIGRLADGKFAGEWKSKMANGTFELSRAKKRG